MVSGVLLAGFFIVLMPVSLRNYAVGGRLHLTTSQFGPNFYIGNHDRASGLYESLLPGRGNVRYERIDATELAEQAIGRKMLPAEVSQYWLAKAVTYICSKPGNWLQLLARKAALTCNAVEAMDTVDQYTYARWSWPLRFLGHWWNFGLLAILAALGVWCMWKERGRLSPLYLMLAGYELSLLAFYVMARYRQPAIPILILIASAGVMRAIGSWRGSSRMGKAILVAMLLAVAAVAQWPLLDAAKMGASTYFNCGNALADLKRLEAAVTLYQEGTSENYFSELG
jgi:hypothetical protein